MTKGGKDWHVKHSVSGKSSSCITRHTLAPAKDTLKRQEQEPASSSCCNRPTLIGAGLKSC
jgi:hypothetical protein